MSKHTPSPWILNGLEIYIAIDNLRICEVFELGDTITAEANARLIATAPELLDAVQTYLSNFEHLLGCECCQHNFLNLQPLREVIKKGEKEKND